MAYNPTDPGPVLASYDPNWKARFETADSQLRAIGEGTILDRDQAELQTRLVEEKGASYLAQHRHAWEREAFLRDQYVPPFIGPEPGQIDLPVPSPAHDASPEEMLAHYQRFERLACDLQHTLELEPATDWESGLFAETLVDGRTREVFDAEIPLDWGSVPIRARFAVEAWDDVVHVCALQRPHGDEVVAGVTNHVPRVAAWAAERYLPCPGRLAALLRPSRRRLFLYTTYTPSRHGPYAQPVWGREVRWSRGGRLETVAIGARDATPWLREEALKLHPELWHAVIAVEAQRGKGETERARS